MIVTSASRAYLERVGFRALRSWVRNGRHLPTIFTVSEDELRWEDFPLEFALDDLELEVIALDEHPVWNRFYQTYGPDPLYNGRVPNQPGPWKPRAVEGGYNFRFDAVKFSKKAFALGLVAERLARFDYEGPLFWLDADVVARRPFDYGLLTAQLGDADVAYVGRGTYHPDAAFLGFRFPRAAPLIRALAALYAGGGFMSHREWHDAYLFKRILDAHWGRVLRVNNLNPTNEKSPRVFERTPLGAAFTHLKGDRKDENGNRLATPGR